MLLAKDRLPDHDDLITIRNLPLVLRQITLLTECTALEDLGLTTLTLPARVEFPASHCYDARSQYFPQSVTAHRFFSFPLDYIIDPRRA